jgi:hypothetical protein
MLTFSTKKTRHWLPFLITSATQSSLLPATRKRQRPCFAPTLSTYKRWLRRVGQLTRRYDPGRGATRKKAKMGLRVYNVQLQRVFDSEKVF